jgi:hypothetical protein
LALVLTGLLLFPSAGQDDTHITCWPAYTLSHYGQILNYNGQRVEQSSSLLQVLLLAALHVATGMNVVTLAKLASIAAGVASVVTLSTLVARVTTRAAGLWAASIATLSTPVVYWSFSGMETSLVSLAGLCLVLTAADYLSQHPRASAMKVAAALAAFAAVRPEAPLLMAATAGAAFAVGAAASALRITSPEEWRCIRSRGVTLAILAAAVCAVLFAFRRFYFGDFWPQPVAAKFSGVSWRNLIIGLHYVKGHAWNPSPATALVSTALAVSLVATLAGQLRARTLNPYVLLSALFACGSLAFVVTSGGDWMPGGRFLAHFLPVAIAFVPFAVQATTSRRWALPMTAIVLMALEGAAMGAFARSASPSFPLWARLADSSRETSTAFSWFERHSRINVRDMTLIAALDDVIARIGGSDLQPVVVMSGQMGMVSYHIAVRHFGRVRFLDRHGLIERSLTDCVAARSLPRDTGGLVISVRDYLNRLDELRQDCQLPEPDVVFDIGRWSSSPGAAGDYDAVYEQRGIISVAGTRLIGGQVVADAFIAVKRGRLAARPPSGDERPDVSR